MKRRVLERADFGLCVCWPKTHWSHVPAPGGTCAVSIDGSLTTITVRSERCNCQGTGWHEHRFLCLPAALGAPAGAYVAVQAGGNDDESDGDREVRGARRLHAR